MIRPLFFWTHLVLGLSAGLILFVMAVTGLLLAFETQILGMAEAGFRTGPVATAASRGSIEAMLPRVQAFQASALPSLITVQADPTAPVIVRFGKEHLLLVHPQTGAILGEGAVGLRNFFETVLGLHRWLALDGNHRPIGRSITGAAGFIFLLLLVSGLFLWMPRRWRLSHFRVGTVPRIHLKGKARDWNWHNVAGFWLSPLLLITALTGLILSYAWANTLLFRLAGSEAPPPKREAGPGPGPGRGNASGPVSLPALAGLDAALLAATGQVKGWKTASFRLPGPDQAPLEVQLDRGGRGVRPDLITGVSVDLNSAQVLAVKPYDQLPAGRQLRAWVKPVHTGEAAGLFGQALAALAAAGTALLVWTGVSLAGRRFFRRRPAPATPR